MFRLLSISSGMIGDTLKNVFRSETQDFADRLNRNGGLCAKVAQALSLEDYDKKVFEMTNPVNPKATKAIKEQYVQRLQDENVDLTVEPEASWFGSVGQVYRGLLFDEAASKDINVVLKVKYAGIESMVDKDMYLLHKGLKVYSKDMYVKYKTVVHEVTHCIQNELNFKREAENVVRMSRLFASDSRYVTPTYLRGQFSEDGDVLLTTQIMGERLNHWLEQQPSQEKKNQVATLIFTFVYTLLNCYNIIYPDSHWTNFLVIESSKGLQLGIVDFGSVIYLPSDFRRCRQQFHSSLVEKDFGQFKRACLDLDLCNVDTHHDHIKQMFEYFLCQSQPLREDQFKFSSDYLGSCKKLPVESAKEMNSRSHLYGMIRSSHAVYTMMCVLEAEGHFKAIYEDTEAFSLSQEALQRKQDALDSAVIL